MIRTVTVLFALLTIVASAALAVSPPEDQGFAVLGIYTQPEASEDAAVMLEDVDAGVPYTIYFVMYHHRLDSYNLGGFEFSWSIEPSEMAPMVLETTYNNEQAYNFGDSFNQLVGFAWRQPTAPDAPLLLFSAEIMFLTPPTNANVYLGAAVPASIDGEMVYADLVFPDTLKVMKPNNSSQSLDEPVFKFNPVVATEYQSLSSVKSLFQ